MADRLHLLYRCEKLRCETLRRPCELNVAKARELQSKFPNALLGPLMHCLECQGKDLVVRAAPEGGHTGPPPTGAGAATIREDRIVQEDSNMDSAVTFENQAEALRVLGPGEVPPAADSASPVIATPKPGQFCKNCPGVESHQNKHGKSMGLCRACLAQRAAENSRNRGKEKTKGKMTSAVARDLRKSKNTPGGTPGPPEDPPVCQNAPADPWINVQPVAVKGDPVARCIPHNLPIKFNAKGISMGGCEECRREIAVMGGHKAKIQLAMSPLQRLFAEHGAELAWLCSYAHEQVRTPEGQLIFMIKQSMAQGGQ